MFHERMLQNSNNLQKETEFKTQGLTVSIRLSLKTLPAEVPSLSKCLFYLPDRMNGNFSPPVAGGQLVTSPRGSFGRGLQ